MCWARWGHPCQEGLKAGHQGSVHQGLGTGAVEGAGGAPGGECGVWGSLYLGALGLGTRERLSQAGHGSLLPENRVWKGTHA